MRVQLHSIRKGGALLFNNRKIIHHGSHLHSHHKVKHHSKTLGVHHSSHHKHSAHLLLGHSHQKGASIKHAYIATKKRIEPISYKF